MAGKTSRQSGPSWPATSVLPGPGACADVLALRGKRFLARGEAPALPLAGCTTPTTCKCVYKHHLDRRAGSRRAAERTGIERAAPKEESRTKRGRRETDFAE
jgi:hypothetical protein